MKQHEFIKDFGHCCNACKHYDPMEGYCEKTKSYHYGYDFTYGDGEPCPKWKIADDLKQNMPKKTYKQIKLDLEGKAKNGK